MVQLDARECIPDLVALLSNHWRQTRRAAALALGRLRAAEGLDALTALLRNDDIWEVREDAARGIAMIDSRRGRDELIRCLRDQESWRALAIDMLANMGATDAAPEIRKAVPDVSQVLGGSFETPTALLRLGMKETIPALLKAAEENPGLSPPIIEAMASFRVREAIPLLLRLLRHEGDDVRRSAAWALGVLEVEESIPKLVELLSDVEPVRTRAAASLCRLGSAAGVSDILERAPYYALNSLRSPEVWKRWRDTPLKSTLKGTRREILDQLAQEAGVALEIPDPPIEAEEYWLAGEPEVLADTLLGALELLLEGTSYMREWHAPVEAILEKDRLRILRRPAAQEIWHQWRQSRR